MNMLHTIKRYGSRHVVCLIVVTAFIVVPACEDSESLSFDEQGEPHGSGEKVYHYETGQVMLREQYVDGQVVRSRWYRPDGTLIEETKWANGSGEGIYLRQDGSIRKRMTYVNGIAEGPTTEYDKQGNITEVVQYRAGQRVEQ